MSIPRAWLGLVNEAMHAIFQRCKTYEYHVYGEPRSVMFKAQDEGAQHSLLGFTKRKPSTTLMVFALLAKSSLANSL